MKIRTILFGLSLAICAIILFSCGGNKDNGNGGNNDTLKTVEENLNHLKFNSDSAFYYVEKQTEFGPRVPNTMESIACAKWLESVMGKFADTVYVQEISVRAYNGDILKGRNIISSFAPSKAKRILLGAHWDSRPYADWDPDPANHRKPIDGANDGASGVGVLIEIARTLKKFPADVGVDIVFFDAEDYGEPQDKQGSEKQDTWGLGSQYWAKNPHKPGYSAYFGILLDMVGAANAKFYHEGISMNEAADIVEKVWGKASELGYGNTFINETGSYVTDDHYYVNMYTNIPMIDIIQYDPNTRSGFYPFWHTMDDNIDKIDPATLNIVGQTVLAVIYAE